MSNDQDDRQLLASYARENSEAAFTALVTRHLGLVYSAALRHSHDVHGAEEIAQAVFIILARKAGHLPVDVILSGWLYQTTRLTAANYLRAERRRQQREQIAFMQSFDPQPDANRAWTQVVPLLDDALAILGTRDRDAIVLRFFENKSTREIAAALQVKEAAAHKRVSRAVAKLRKLFLRRGVTLSTAAIAGAISAHSVQAAPAGLAKTISTAVSLKGAAAALSTTTLANTAIKIMTWSKIKAALLTGVIALAATGTTLLVAEKINVKMNSVLKQTLPDGSTLSIEVSFGAKHEIFRNNRKINWNWPDHDELVINFQLTGKNATDNQLVKPDFFRQFRCRLHGEQGIEYVEELEPSAFEKSGDSYYGYIETGIFPRDAHWLWLQLEKRDENSRYDAWQTQAEFKFKNPVALPNRNWVASPAPITNTVSGMDLVLDQIIVKTIANYTNDIWNHVVSAPTRVFKSGALLTNWTAAYMALQDASGNWNPVFQPHRSLDPRFVWKLDADFEPTSDFPVDSVVTMDFPQTTNMITTNILGVPVTISWNGNYLEAQIQTNRTDVALKFMEGVDTQHRKLHAGGASWSKSFFREGGFGAWTGENALTLIDVKPAQFTFAILPNVHTTFYMQPQLETP